MLDKVIFSNLICFVQISSQLSLNRTSTRVSVTSVVSVPLSLMPHSLITVSVDYLQLTQPTLTLSSTLPELLPSLMSSESLGGIAVKRDGSFGYQGFYLSGMCICTVVYTCMCFSISCNLTAHQHHSTGTLPLLCTIIA